MTVNSVSQSYSFSAVRLNVSVRPVTTATTTPAAGVTAEPDRVTLSPAATAQGEGTATPAVDGGETPVTPVKPPTRAERRADALFDALDGDDDGAITEQEFTEGAAALLRRAGERRRARGGDDDDHRTEGRGRPEGGDRSERGENRGSRRLERKLEAAFARVDANQDGSIDKEELTTALAKAGGPRRGGAPPATGETPAAGETPANGDTPVKGTTVNFSFSYVSIAVQRYTTLQTADAPAQKQAA